MSISVLHFPCNDLEREAVEILRVRKTARSGGYTYDEIQWAVSVIQHCDPNHPFLYRHERKPSVAGPKLLK